MPTKSYLKECVCVCVRERETERERGESLRHVCNYID